MKPIFLISPIILCLCLLGSNLHAQKKGFDKHLADSLKADQYGMKKYVLVILKTGPNKIVDQELSDSLFVGHMNQINKWADEGKLVVAGPFMNDQQQWRGLFIFDSSSEEEVNFWLQDDPTIKNRVFAPEIHLWYGSAALPLYLPFHKIITKENP